MLTFCVCLLCSLSLLITTRLHSSRMRTARALTVSPSMLCAGGTWSVGGGCLVPGGAWSGGGAWSREGVVSHHALRQTPPVNRMTNR